MPSDVSGVMCYRIAIAKIKIWKNKIQQLPQKTQKLSLAE